MPQERSDDRWHGVIRVKLLQAVGSAGRLCDLPNILDFGHEQVVVGFKVVADHFEFSAIVKPLVNQYVVDHTWCRWVCQNSAAGGFDKPPRLG
jgi:hypothetical protein